jgi:DNA-binding XRE family transcriptional regulator
VAIQRQLEKNSPVDESNANKVVATLVELVSEYRQSRNLTLEELADRAGIHRTTLGLLERKERNPTLQVALQLASALGIELSELLSRAEAIASGRAQRGISTVGRREVSRSEFFGTDRLRELTGLDTECIRAAMNGCYQTLDTIDFQLAAHSTPPLARLVELANISSMIGNLLGGQIAENSNGLYKRNRPHTYPDLLPVAPHDKDIEIKIALETNYPKGHLPKAGTYMTFRYVLANKAGRFARGGENRGDTVFFWEGRVGILEEDDFAISNTSGDSGKTAVIKTRSLEAMHVFYFRREFLPYGEGRASRYPSASNATLL